MLVKETIGIPVHNIICSLGLESGFCLAPLFVAPLHQMCQVYSKTMRRVNCTSLPIIIAES